MSWLNMTRTTPEEEEGSMMNMSMQAHLRCAWGLQGELLEVLLWLLGCWVLLLQG